MTYIYEFNVATYPPGVEKEADLLGTNPDDAPDVWLPITVDFRFVVAFRYPQEGDHGTWLDMTSGKSYRVDQPYEKIQEIFNKTRS